MSSTEPEVSVVMATYNNGSYLAEAIDSVLAQEGVEGLEVVVVDDASTDDTPRVLENYRNQLVTCTLPANTGCAGTPRNNGFRLARGEFLAIFDSDDVMLPGKLREQCALLRRHPDIPMVFTNFRNFSAGHPAKQDFLADHTRFHAMERQPIGEAWYRLPAERAFETLVVDNFVGTSGVVMRRSLVEEVGHFDERLRCGEDLEYWLRVVRRHDVAYIDREYHRRRLHQNNLSTRTSGMEDLLQMAERLHRDPMPRVARRNLQTWISSLHFVVGYNYKTQGQRLRAIQHYLASLRYNLANPEIPLAILKALVPLPGRSSGR